jgi:hypothetical protein
MSQGFQFAHDYPNSTQGSTQRTPAFHRPLAYFRQVEGVQLKDMPPASSYTQKYLPQAPLPVHGCQTNSSEPPSEQRYTRYRLSQEPSPVNSYQVQSSGLPPVPPIKDSGFAASLSNAHLVSHFSRDADASWPRLGFSPSPTTSTEPRIITRLRDFVVEFFVEWWLLEIMSWCFAAICMGSVIAVLGYYNGRQIPNWPLGITINGFISVCSGFAKSSLLLVTCESLGQLKWVRIPVLSFAKEEDSDTL